MPRPRFAPVGRRAAAGLPQGLPGSVGGLGLPSSPLPGGGLPGAGGSNLPGTPPAPSQKDRASALRKIYEQMGASSYDDPAFVATETNLTPGEQAAVAPMVQRAMQQYSRPSTALQIIGRVLGTGESAAAGFLKGATEHVPAKDFLATTVATKYLGLGPAAILYGAQELTGTNATHQLAPWTYFHSVGQGFDDVPAAVKDGYTYENLLKDRNDPNSLLYQHAMPIGFGLSLVADPVMYLSFGASTPTKIAANEHMALAGEKAANLALKWIADGTVVDGKVYKEHDAQEAFWHAYDNHIKGPKDLGEAIDQISAAEREVRGARRAGKGRQLQIESLQASGRPERAAQLAGRPIRGALYRERSRLGAAIMPYGGKGGRGIRFAGGELPGTPQLGAYLGRKTRELTTTLSGKSRGFNAAVDAMIPNSAKRHVASDLLRASASTETRRFRDIEMQGQRLMDKHIDDLLSATINTADGQKLEIRDAMARQHRLGVLNPEPYKWQSVEQKQLASIVQNRVDVAIKVAASQGAGDEKALRKSWAKLQKNIKDPVIAASRFMTDVQVKADQRKFVNRMLTDPRFSIKLAKENEKGIHDIPDGFGSFQHGGREYAVIRPVADALSEFRNEAFLQKELNRFYQSMDIINYPQKWWKIYATTPNPSFHTMNFLGAVWNNLLASVYNPSDTVDALGVLYRHRLEQAAESGRTTYWAPARKLRGKAPVSTPLGKEAKKLLEGAEARGGLGRSSFVWAETEKLGERFSQPELRGNLKERILKPGPELEGKKFAGARHGVKQARRATAVGLAVTPGFGPFIGGVLLAPEIARKGREVGGFIEDWVRLAPYLKEARDPAVMKALAAFTPTYVPNTQMMHLPFSKDIQRSMHDVAGAVSRHFQLDYTDLTDFERYVAKSFFPFYTFYKKNFLLQAEQLVKTPRKLMAAQAFMNFMNENGDVSPQLRETVLPTYFDNLSAFQIPVPKSVRKLLGLPKDEPLFLNPKLPFVSLNLFPPIWQAFQNSPTPSPQKWGGVMAPIFGSVGPWAMFPFPGAKMELEYEMGYQLGLNRPIDFQRSSSNDWRNNHVPAPGWSKLLPDFIAMRFGIVKAKDGTRVMTPSKKYVLDQLSTPFISNWGSSIPTAQGDPESESKARADMVSWMTGIRLMPMDVHRLSKNYAYGLKNMLEAKKSERKDLGYPGLEEEDQIMLNYANAEILQAKAVDAMDAAALGYNHP